MEKAELKIDGMHCDACVRRVTAALTRVEGATPEKVEVGSAVVSFDPAKTGVDELKASIEKAGFQVKEL